MTNIILMLVFAIAILAAFWSGFYVGYLKREGEPPEIPLPNIKEIINNIKPEKKQRLSKAEEIEQAKANVFYN
ncbi:MAG: hypothetical protein WC616_02475 [Candidatus Omnitrophota bacterium]